MLYSLDVVSLFTNIPRDLVLSLIKEKWLFISAYTDMPKNLFIDIIAYIYDSSYFQFEGEFYQQIDGSAMGNPASPSLANFIMTYLIEKVLQKLKFIVAFIKLYVDDTITAIPSDKADELLSEFNSYHPRIKFTIEKEKDGELPFLDIKVVRGEDGSLLTKWYVKPTNSGRLVNFHSETSRSYKVGSIKNLIYRSTHLSSKIYYKENMKKIKEILKINNYPTTFVNKIINEYNPLNPRINETLSSEDQVKRYFKFPYISGLSHNIAHSIKQKSKTTELVFYNLLTTQILFSKLKDPTPNINRSSIVYKIPCLGCNKCYVGQTRQLLKTRIRQHKYDCDDRFRDKDSSTALASHRFAESHNFDFDNVEILDYESNWKKRNISEMIHIRLNNTVNHRTDTQDLSQLYTNLLFLCRDSRIPI
ncbi:uncharacterized protein LOC123312358 [Coccinella septempunctata]|nr:uncharacterized protein LOC123312358 [Coccinella septempunctata]